MHRSLKAAAASLLVALAVAGPVSASSAERFSFSETIVDTFSCGVVLTIQINAEGTVHLASDGSWQFTQIRFWYQGTLDPTLGTTKTLPSRQILKEGADGTATSGQGFFVRIPGEGAVLLDVGHLVFDPGDGSTIKASAQVFRFDDPDQFAKIDATICGLFD